MDTNGQQWTTVDNSGQQLTTTRCATCISDAVFIGKMPQNLRNGKSEFCPGIK